MRVLAIVPAYNEQDSIISTIEEFASTNTGCDFIVINDGSTDHTEEICREHNYPHLSHPTNLGLTGGFQTGVKYALSNDYDAVIQFDADGQHMPSYVSAMIDKMEQTGADIVIGSRYIVERKPFTTRMIGSRLLSALIWLTTGKWLTDPTSGMRLYNRKGMEEFARTFDFGPEPDSIAYLMRKGFKVAEIQVSMRDRKKGNSYLSPWQSISYMARICTSILFVQWVR